MFLSLYHEDTYTSRCMTLQAVAWDRSQKQRAPARAHRREALVGLEIPLLLDIQACHWVMLGHKTLRRTCHLMTSQGIQLLQVLLLSVPAPGC